MIHNNSFIHPSAHIGIGVTIWQNTQVRENAYIGDYTSIGANSYIGPGVRIGSNCKIQNNVLIYEPTEIGNFVFIGPNVVFTNDKNPRSFNNDYTPRTKNDWSLKKVVVNNHVSIGASSTCVAPINLGAFSIIGASSLVIKSTKPNSLNFGSPAKFISWIDNFGEKLIELPNGKFKSKINNQLFILDDNNNLRNETVT